MKFKKTTKLIAPPRLRLGDTVALIRPASKIDEKKYKQSVRWLREFGFCVAIYPRKRKTDSFFAFSDKDRAAELNWAFSQPGIKAVLACRAGYGSVRLLPYIKKSDMRRWQPKLFLGYSDVTFIHQWLQNELGWKSVHGPLTGFLNKVRLYKVLNEVLKLGELPKAETWAEAKNIGSSKKVKGRLVGGTLSLLEMTGSAALPKRPVILAIEDVNENYYSLDRMIQTLIDGGYGKYVKGILLGNLKGCGKNDSGSFKLSRVHESLKVLSSGPVWTRCRFGHANRQRENPMVFSALCSPLTLGRGDGALRS